MKKLLVLALIMGIASLATAGLEWNSSSGSFTVAPGEILTLTLNGTDGDTASGVSVGIITDNGASGVFTAWGTSPVFSTIGTAGGTFGLSGAALNAAAGSTVMDDDDIGWLDALSTEAATAQGLLVLTYQVGDDAAGTITINGAPLGITGQGDNIKLLSGFVPTPVIDLTVIPEPATLALLGLGALVLRRKK